MKLKILCITFFLIVSFTASADTLIPYIGDLQSFNQIGYTKARDQALSEGYNITGKGQTVCYIGSGIAANSPAWPDCNGTKFRNDGCERLRLGYNFIADSPGGEDDYGLGTAFATIVAGSDPVNYTGLMPESQMIPMKISDENGNNWEDYAEAAIEWCTANASKYNITVIQIDFAYDGELWNDTYNCTGGTDDAAITAAYNAGITIIGHSGDSYNTTGVGWPACNPRVIGVGAVCDNGQCTGDNEGFDEMLERTNRYPILDVLAPGKAIRTFDMVASDHYAGNLGSVSAAVSHTVGAAMFVRDYYEMKYGITLTPQEIEDILIETGDPVIDPETGISYPRINLYNAINWENISPSLAVNSGSMLGQLRHVEISINISDEHHNISRCSLVFDGIINQTYEFETLDNNTCSEQWGFQCGVEDSQVDNTFDSCTSGYNSYPPELGGTSSGGGRGVLEAELNNTIIMPGEPIDVTCTLRIMNDGWYTKAGVYYYNGTEWSELYYDSNVPEIDAPNYQINLTFTPDNYLGTQWVRCSEQTASISNITNFCADSSSYDNDDVAFEVSSNYRKYENRNEGSLVLKETLNAGTYNYSIICYDSSSNSNPVQSEYYLLEVTQICVDSFYNEFAAFFIIMVFLMYMGSYAFPRESLVMGAFRLVLAVAGSAAVIYIIGNFRNFC